MLIIFLGFPVFIVVHRPGTQAKFFFLILAVFLVASSLFSVVLISSVWAGPAVTSLTASNMSTTLPRVLTNSATRAGPGVALPLSARVSTSVASQTARRAYSALRHTRSWATPLAAAAALGWWVHGLWQRRAGHHLTMGSFKTSSSASFSARSSVSSSPLFPLSERPEALAVEQELARMMYEEYLSLSSEEWTQRLQTQRLQKHNVVLADVLSSVDRATLLRNIYIYFMKSPHVERRAPKVPTAISAQYLFLHDVARQPSLRLSRRELAIKLRISIKSLDDLRMRLKRFLTHYPSELGTEGLLSYDAHLYESLGPLTLDQLHERTGRYREAFLSGDFQLKLPLDIKNRIDSYISFQNSRGTFLHNMQRTFARASGVAAQDVPVRALKYQFVFFTRMTDIQPLSHSRVSTLLGITPVATQRFSQSLKTFLRYYDDPLLAQEDGATLEEPSPASFSRSAFYIEFSPRSEEYQPRIDPKVRELKQLKEQYFALSQDQWIAKMSALTGAGSQSLISSSPRDLLQDLTHFFQKETSHKYYIRTAQLLFLRRLFGVQEAPLPPLSKGYEEHIRAFLERHYQQQQSSTQSEAQRAYEDLTKAFLDESHHSYSQVESLLLSLFPEPLAHSQKARELLLAFMEKSPTYVVHYFLARELQLHSSLSREDMKSYYGVPRPKEALLANLRQRLAQLTRFHFETFPTSAQELELFLQKHWQNTLDGMYNRELTTLYHLAPESIDRFLNRLEIALVSFTEAPTTRERILERRYLSLWSLLGWKGAASRDLAAQILGMPFSKSETSLRQRVSEHIHTALHGLRRIFSDANALYEFQVSHLKHTALMEQDQYKTFDYRVHLQDQQTLEESVGLYFTQNPELYESSISRSLFLASLDLPVISDEDLARIFDTSEEDIAQRLLTYRQHWLGSHLISSLKPRSYHELDRALRHLPMGAWEQLTRKWWGQGQGSVEYFKDLVMNFFETYGRTDPLKGHVFLALVLKMEQPSRSTKLAIIREHQDQDRFNHSYIPIAGPTENLRSVQLRQRGALLAFQKYLRKAPNVYRDIDTVEQIRSITMAAFKNISSEQTRFLAAQWGAQYHDQPERVELWRERMLTFGEHLLANHPDDFDLFITRVLALTHIDKARYMAATGKSDQSIYKRARSIHTRFNTYLQEGLFSQH